jgi:hypothetical protein
MTTFFTWLPSCEGAHKHEASNDNKGACTHKVLKLTMSLGLDILRGFVQNFEIFRRFVLGPRIEILRNGVGSCSPATQVHLDLLRRWRTPSLNRDRYFFGREQFDQGVGRVDTLESPAGRSLFSTVAKHVSRGWSRCQRWRQRQGHHTVSQTGRAVVTRRYEQSCIFKFSQQRQNQSIGPDLTANAASFVYGVELVERSLDSSCEMEMGVGWFDEDGPVLRAL